MACCDVGVVNVIITGVMNIELEASYEQEEKSRDLESVKDRDTE